MVQFIIKNNGGDERGLSFSLDSKLIKVLGQAKGCHVASINPGFTRGDHYHIIKTEMLFILPGCSWRFYWDAGPNKSVSTQIFDGSVAVYVLIPPGESHAIRNTGVNVLYFVNLSDRAYSEFDTDTYRRIVSM